MHVAPACLDTDVAKVPKQAEGQQLAVFQTRRGLLGNSKDITGSLALRSREIKVSTMCRTRQSSELHR